MTDKEKIFHFDGIDLFNEGGNFLFVTKSGKRCLYDVSAGTEVFNEIGPVSKVYVDCFLEDNAETIELWKNWQVDYSDFDGKFIETL